MDRYEDNDSAAAATNLGTISGTVTQATLDIQANDPDWYRFTIGSAGRTGDRVTVSFTHAQGDIDMELYASNGTTLINSSTGVGNSEEISLAGLAAGTYFAKVYGYSGASNPNYTLAITAAPTTTTTGDRFEDNDSAAAATNLSTVSGTVNETGLSIQAGDPDWYKFTLGSAGRTGDKVSIAFTHSLGDVDMELYASNGTTLINSSAGVSNSEEISLAGLAAGTYYAKVFGYSGAANPSYSLSLAVAPTTTTTGDRLEDNDTASTATNFNTVSGTVTESGLSIQANDPDWYRFTIPSAGRTGDKVSLAFTHALGDVDMELYASNGTTLVGSSTGVGNSEEISLAGLAAGTYLAKVYGYSGAANPSYSISVTANPTTTTTGDRFEDNDTAATATDLRSVSGTVTETGLNIQANDPDWYKFTMGSVGRTGDKVALAFTHTLGDVDLVLYRSDGVTQVGSSTGVGNSEEISLAGLAAGTYLAKVYGYSGASNPNYSVSVTVAPTTTTTGDRFEDNDSAATATDLRTISGTATETGLNIQANDPDWYKFTLGSAGRTGDKVALAFTHSLGDIDMVLYRSDGTTQVGASTGVGNSEEISLAGLAAGTYLARVYGYSGASNPNYSLSVTVSPTSTTTGDRFEDNDTSATATDLRTISGTVTETGLNIQANDPDWYKFTMGSAGRTGDKVSLAFTHALGDIDMVLYRSDGTTQVGASTGVGNSEEISLAGLAAGTYLAKVYGYNGASNPSYNLALAVAPTATTTGDRFEDNDTASAATDLRTISGTVTETGLNIQANDPDWYKFTMGSAGRTGDKISLAFTHAQGDVDIVLYRADGTTQVGASTGVGNSEEISLAGLAAGTYLAKVYGYSGASNPNYSVSVAVAPTTATTGDRFENNDSSATATDLRSISGTVSEAGLNIEANDPDWYKFTLPAAGRTGDKISLAFTHAQGDIDMVLYASNGTTQIAASTGVGNSEEISLAGLAAGNYYAKVYGYNGVANPNYSLAVAVAPSTPTTTTGDRFEDNDTAAAATDLRTVTGSMTETGLSIQANDPDWFKFTLPSTGRASDKVSLAFTHAQGDIDMVLYRSDGTTQVGSSTGTGNSEQISLSGLAAGSYLLKVYGYSGAANPNYALTVAAAGPTSLSADSWEANNTGAQATQIRQAQQSFNDATITTGDQDWFQFSLPAAGVAADRVSVLADGGNLTVRLLNASQQQVATATTDASGQATLPLASLPAGSYFVNVAGQSSTDQATYDLDVRAAGASTTPGTSTNEWTVLVYIAGDNNLEGAGVEDINEMESAALRAGLNVGVLFDRSTRFDSSNGNWTDARRGVIVRDGNTSTISSSLTSIGEVDTGAQSTLTNFINWGAANLPAQRYAVIIWDHGGGAILGSANDDSSPGSALTNTEVRNAIAGSTIGRADVVGFDACLMAMVETASDLSAVASMLVVSQQTEGGDGWEYTSWLNRISSVASADAATVATLVVDTYVPSPGGGTTLSAVDLSRVSAVETAINNFVTVMRSAPSADWSAVQTARSRSTESDPDFSYSVDLVSFMNNLQAASSNSAVDSAAAAVVTALQASVIRHVGGSQFYGLSIVFPDRADPRPGEYARYTSADQRFLANTSWDDFLTLYLAGGRSATDDGLSRVAGVAPDFAERVDLAGRSRSFNNDTSATSLDLGQIVSSTYRVDGLTIDSVTDVDWFRFSLPSGLTYRPSLTVQSGDAASALSVRVLDASQTLIAQGSTAGSGSFSTSVISAGGSYFLEVRGADGSVTTPYSVLANAFGSSPPAEPMADFAEAEGGNDSREKAFLLGVTPDLEQIGGARNLSFTTTDAGSGSSGGDWFAITASRTTESNANWIAITNPTSSSGNLDLRVYDSAGTLLGQSATGSSVEIVSFPQQISTVYAQVFSSSGRSTTGYALQVRNDAPATLDGSDGNDVLIDYSTGGAVLRGLVGNDQLDGRSGIDTAAYGVRRSDATVARTASGYTVTSSAEGADSLTAIERVRFSDLSVALDLDGNAGMLVKTLGAIFGRAIVADKASVGLGLYYADSGLDSRGLMQAALDARLGPSPRPEAVVDLIYTNIVGVAPSAADRATYVGLLNTGVYTPVTLGLAAADVGLNLTNIDFVGLQQHGVDFVPYVPG